MIPFKVHSEACNIHSSFFSPCLYTILLFLNKFLPAKLQDVFSSLNVVLTVKKRFLGLISEQLGILVATIGISYALLVL